MSTGQMLDLDDVAAVGRAATSRSIVGAISEERDSEYLGYFLRVVRGRNAVSAIPAMSAALKECRVAVNVAQLADWLGSLGMSAGARLRSVGAAALVELLHEWPHPATKEWDLALINTIESAVELAGQVALVPACESVDRLTPAGRARLESISKISPALNNVMTVVERNSR